MHHRNVHSGRAQGKLDLLRCRSYGCEGNTREVVIATLSHAGRFGVCTYSRYVNNSPFPFVPQVSLRGAWPQGLTRAPTFISSFPASLVIRFYGTCINEYPLNNLYVEGSSSTF